MDPDPGAPQKGSQYQAIRLSDSFMIVCRANLLPRGSSLLHIHARSFRT